MKLRLKKLNQHGFDHVLLGISFAVVIAIGGTWYLIHVRAAQWNGALAVASQTSGYCMDAPTLKSGSYVYLNKCSAKLSQKWQLANAGTVKVGTISYTAYNVQNYTAGSQTCVDDWNRSTAQGKNNLARLYTCNGADPAQRFYWAGDGHQLKNVASGLCIDDIGNGRAANTSLDFYACKTNTTASQNKNQDWWEIGNGAANPTTGSGSSTGTKPPISGQPGAITASNGKCITASGATVTLATCTGAGNQSWGQVATNDGSPSEQFYNATGNVYLGATGQSVGAKVVGVGTATNATWTASDNGDGTNMLSIDTGGAYCLAVSSSSLTIANCSAGSSAQSFTLPNPYVGTAASTGSQTGDSGDSSGSGDTTGSAGATDDITTLLSALQSADPSFDCTSLSDVSIVQQCQSVFAQ